MAEIDSSKLTTLTVQLLSAYVSKNSVANADLPGLIQMTRKALAADIVASEPSEIDSVPAVSVRKSLSSKDHILSMIDGKPYKTLKRHLVKHGLTPDDYRKRYKLAADYPMVAQGYSDQRRDVAARMGLGRDRAKAKPADAAPPASSPATDALKTAAKAPAKSRKSIKTKAAVTTKPKSERATAKAPSVEPTIQPAGE